MEYDLLPLKIWIRLKKCKNENDDWWKMASWPPWANEAWDRQRRADGQGGSWVGGYISPNLGYISLNMDIYFNCEYLSFNHGNLSLKWEYISLHFIYSSRNIGYISLKCKCNMYKQIEFVIAIHFFKRETEKQTDRQTIRKSDIDRYIDIDRE